MAAECVDCAEPLPLMRRLLGKERCETCEQKHADELRRERQEQEAQYNAAVAEYREVVEQLEPGTDLQVITARIEEAMRITPLAPPEVERLNSEALSGFIARARGDGVISPGEDKFMAQAVQLLGLRFTPEQYRDYMVAALESGLVIHDPQPQIGVPNPDEVPHWHIAAELLEQHVETELQWTSVAPSVPVGEGGVRAQFEAGRGRFVETGRSVRVADRGVLSVTSQRTVFSGNTSTFEYPHQRLLGARLFTDGVGLQIVNRQQMPTFRTGPMVNEITAAVVLTAAQRVKGTLVQKPWTEVARKSLPAMPALLQGTGYRDPSPATQIQRRAAESVDVQGRLAASETDKWVPDGLKVGDILHGAPIVNPTIPEDVDKLLDELKKHVDPSDVEDRDAGIRFQFVVGLLDKPYLEALLQMEIRLADLERRGIYKRGEGFGRLPTVNSSIPDDVERLFAELEKRQDPASLIKDDDPAFGLRQRFVAGLVDRQFLEGVLRTRKRMAELTGRGTGSP
jgi:hypothetical protein